MDLDLTADSPIVVQKKKTGSGKKKVVVQAPPVIDLNVQLNFYHKASVKGNIPSKLVRQETTLSDALRIVLPLLSQDDLTSLKSVEFTAGSQCEFKPDWLGQYNFTKKTAKTASTATN